MRYDQLLSIFGGKLKQSISEWNDLRSGPFESKGPGKRDEGDDRYHFTILKTLEIRKTECHGIKTQGSDSA